MRNTRKCETQHTFNIRRLEVVYKVCCKRNSYAHVRIGPTAMLLHVMNEQAPPLRFQHASFLKQFLALLQLSQFLA